MAIFKKRLPSSQEAIYGFAAFAFPIHVWLIINVMREIPAWILRLNIWDLVGVVAYSQVLALLETTLVFLATVLLVGILPTAWFRRRFIASSGALAFIVAIWFVFLHYNGQIIEQRLPVPLLIWGVSLIFVLMGSLIVIHRFRRVEAAIENLVKRLAVLSFIYLFLDFVSLILVIIRNV